MRRRRDPETIAGRVNGAGGITAGDGFAARTTGTGVYVIDFPAAFRILSFTGTSESGGRILGVVYSGNSVTVTSYIANTLAADGQPFSFVAVGVQQ